MQETQTISIKVFREGQYQWWTSNKPSIVNKLSIWGNKLDQFFVTGHWPKV
ncbi:MAG: hypothetical protein NVS1B10_08750 [Candidatus Saccharimonadales bacterium]